MLRNTVAVMAPAIILAGRNDGRLFPVAGHLRRDGVNPADRLMSLERGATFPSVDCVHRAAAVIKPVSADSLRKTGIFADRAGDFRQFPPQDRRARSAETKSNARKAGISGPFSCSSGSRAERRRLAGAGGIEPPNRGIKIRLIHKYLSQALCHRACRLGVDATVRENMLISQRDHQ